MKLLYFAYDYPPERSPQSLRTARLTAGLVAAGHDVTVVTRRAHVHESTGDEPVGGSSPGSLRVLRHAQGPLNRLADRLLQWHARRRPIPSGAPQLDRELHDDDSAHIPFTATDSPSINWKGRFLSGLRTREDALFFPGRAFFWSRHAKRRLIAEVNAGRVDGVILSHEPASTLLLAEVCLKLGVPYIAELGDPVLAPYTPVRWAARAFRLERAVSRSAAALVVTSDATGALLRDRHGPFDARISVIEQGFDSGWRSTEEAAHTQALTADARPLKLVYCGRFYRFRDPAPLFEAVAQSAGNVQLHLATPEIPQWLEFSMDPRSNTVDHGFLPHQDSVALQATADVLVNFANADPTQVPGKFYEYLGMCKPILHVSSSPDSDPQARMVRELRRGWVLPADSAVLAQEIRRLSDLMREDRLHDGLDLTASSVRQFSWENLGRRFAEIIESRFDQEKTGTVK